MTSAAGPGRDWDAASYHQVSGPMEAMGRAVVERLSLSGEETVLDAGCGTGRVTAALLERLPTGRVIAVDADPDMVRVARDSLAPAIVDGRLDVIQADLLHLGQSVKSDSVDAVLSTATFHWVLDHDRLFRELLTVMRSGSQLVAQCGGAGNVAAVLAAADGVAARPEYAARFKGWTRPTRYESADDTEARLVDAGFVDVECWLAPNPVIPDDPVEYLRTIVLGAHVQRLDLGDVGAFMLAVVAELPAPVTVDYVRLNIGARRPSSR